MTDSINLFKMPIPEPNGFIKTMNNMGFMTSSLDPFSTEFINFAPLGPGPALEIGAAYGIATLAALENGAEVIANDLDSRHLDILLERTPQTLKSQLRLQAGAFPDQVNLPPSSIGSALICRVMHFLAGTVIEKASSNLFDWLAPGGKVFVVAETPYLKSFENFIPIYEARKKAGNLWPGQVDDIKVYAPRRADSLPKMMHLLDPEVLMRIFINSGFVVEKASTFARPDFPLDIQLDGRESVGLIARKP